jgi:hypothetical protein
MLENQILANIEYICLVAIKYNKKDGINDDISKPTIIYLKNYNLSIEEGSNIKASLAHALPRYYPLLQCLPFSNVDEIETPTYNPRTSSTYNSHGALSRP